MANLGKSSVFNNLQKAINLLTQTGPPKLDPLNPDQRVKCQLTLPKFDTGKIYIETCILMSQTKMTIPMT